MAFKIPYTNFQIGKTQNLDKPQPVNTKIIEKIILRQQTRQREDIKSWRLALEYAEDTINPDRSELIKIYKDVDLDGHITGIIGSIKNKIKAIVAAIMVVITAYEKIFLPKIFISLKLFMPAIFETKDKKTIGTPISFKSFINIVVINEAT